MQSDHDSYNRMKGIQRLVLTSEKAAHAAFFYAEQYVRQFTYLTDYFGHSPIELDYTRESLDILDREIKELEEIPEAADPLNFLGKGTALKLGSGFYLVETIRCNLGGQWTYVESPLQSEDEFYSLVVRQHLGYSRETPPRITENYIDPVVCQIERYFCGAEKSYMKMYDRCAALIESYRQS